MQRLYRQVLRVCRRKLQNQTHVNGCKCYLEYAEIKDKILKLKCCKFNKSHEKIFNENLKKRFTNIYNFCKLDIDKVTLMLRSSVYPC